MYDHLNRAFTSLTSAVRLHSEPLIQTDQLIVMFIATA